MPSCTTAVNILASTSLSITLRWWCQSDGFVKSARVSGRMSSRRGALGRGKAAGEAALKASTGRWYDDNTCIDIQTGTRQERIATLVVLASMSFHRQTAAGAINREEKTDDATVRLRGAGGYCGTVENLARQPVSNVICFISSRESRQRPCVAPNTRPACELSTLSRSLKAAAEATSVAAFNGFCNKAISAVGVGRVRCLLDAAELDQLTPTQQCLDQRTSLQHVARDEQQG